MLKDHGGRGLAVDVQVVHLALADDTEVVLRNPSPVSDLLGDGSILDLLLGLEVGNLNSCGGASELPDGGDIFSSMHEHGIDWHVFLLHRKVLGGINNTVFRLIFHCDVLL